MTTGPKTLQGRALGHARRTITGLYAVGLQHDEAWRREWRDRLGLGFVLVERQWATNVVSVDREQAAYANDAVDFRTAPQVGTSVYNPFAVFRNPKWKPWINELLTSRAGGAWWHGRVFCLWFLTTLAGAS